MTTVITEKERLKTNTINNYPFLSLTLNPLTLTVTQHKVNFLFRHFIQSLSYVFLHIFKALHWNLYISRYVLCAHCFFIVLI